MPARKKRNFSFGTTQYSAALGRTYTSDRERKKGIVAQRRERILDKKLRAQELAADAKLKAAEKKIAAVEKVADRKIEKAETKIDTAEKKVSKGALTESGFEAIKARMEREIADQERYKQAAIAKYGNPVGNPSFGFGVYRGAGFGEEQIAHFKSKAAAETWARSNDVKGYKIKRAFEKNTSGVRSNPDSYRGARIVPLKSAGGYHVTIPARIARDRREKQFDVYGLPQAKERIDAEFGSPNPSAEEYRRAQMIVDRTPARLRSAYTMGTAGPPALSNPSAPTSSRNQPIEIGDDSEEYKQALRTAELFHGRPVKEEIEVEEKIRTHDWYVSIGPLVKLIVKPLTKKPRKRVPLPFHQSAEGTVQLFCSPDGRQFYLRGGDQELDLAAFDMGQDTEWYRDHMLIGEAVEITYRDRKKFHSFKLVDYFHKLGEITKKKPMLMYDALSKKLQIVGGQYKVEMEDLVDGMSPGIVN